MGIKELMDEISDWGARDYPLAGGDVLSMIVKHGLATAPEAVAAYEGARAKVRTEDGRFAETVEVVFTDVTKPDDKIPF